MKELIIELITEYGFETVIIAFLINILTGVIKMPIKKIARKLDDSSVLTRFIVFLPILLGFGITCLYVGLFKNGIVFNREFFTLFGTATSLSLTFYAIFEKLIPSKTAIEHKTEANTSAKILDLIKEVIYTSTTEKESVQLANQSPKLVLRGKHDTKIENEEE